MDSLSFNYTCNDVNPFQKSIKISNTVRRAREIFNVLVRGHLLCVCVLYTLEKTEKSENVQTHAILRYHVISHVITIYNSALVCWKAHSAVQL